MYQVTLDVGFLDCLNLNGLSLGINGSRDKLLGLMLYYYDNSRNPLPNHGVDPIALRVNPLNKKRYILLHGHHRSYTAYLFDEAITGIVYESSDEIIGDDIARLNYSRGLSFHNMASVMGHGTIPELINEELGKKYISYLGLLTHANRRINDLINLLEDKIF